MKSFVSNDNTSSHGRGQGGAARIRLEPSCHNLVIHAELSWDAVEILDSMLIAFGEFQQVIQSRRILEAEKEQLRAENDNRYEVRKAENFRNGQRFAEGLKVLCEEGYARHEALSKIASSYGKSIKEIEALITYFNRQTKPKIHAERMARVEVLMAAGRSASEIGKDIGVSKAHAHRLMSSLKETGNE